LREHLSGAELTLMRSPVAGRHTTPDADLFFVSSYDQAEALLAMSPERPVRLCLMVETGDGREGIPAALAPAEARRLAGMEGAVLAGLATNAACARPQAPLGEALAVFAAAAQEVERELGAGLPVISAGGSGLLRLLLEAGTASEEEASGARELFRPLTELRAGESLLLGRVPSGITPGLFLPGAHRDACVIEAPVLEVFEKNGRPQALAGLGVQDVGHGPLICRSAGISPARITSDYLMLDCEREAAPAVGSRLTFIPTYYALLAAMSSPFVRKNYLPA
jgi:predicted amino acid racemase